MKQTVKKSALLKSHLNWVNKEGLSSSKECDIISNMKEEIKKASPYYFQEPQVRIIETSSQSPK